MKVLKKKTIILLYAIFIFSFFPSRVGAQQFKSEFYSVESGNFIFAPDIPKSSGNYNLAGSFGEGSKSQFEINGYLSRIGSGIENPIRASFRTRLSTSQLVFDSVLGNVESVQTALVDLYSGTKGSFVTSIHQEEAFSNDGGGVIRETACDLKSRPCTPVQLQLWEKTPGFGYRLTGDKGHRPLYLSRGGGKSAVIAGGTVDAKGKHLSLEFKLRLPRDLPEGIYRSSVVVTTSSDY